MTLENRERRPCQESAAHQPISPETHLTQDEHGEVRPWFEAVRWWDRADWIYARGVHDGYEAGVAAERARQAAEDDLVHRGAVERLVRFIEVVDRRDAYDRGQAA